MQLGWSRSRQRCNDCRKPCKRHLKLPGWDSVAKNSSCVIGAPGALVIAHPGSQHHAGTRAGSTLAPIWNPRTACFLPLSPAPWRLAAGPRQPLCGGTASRQHAHWWSGQRRRGAVTAAAAPRLPPRVAPSRGSWSASCCSKRRRRCLGGGWETSCSRWSATTLGWPPRCRPRSRPRHWQMRTPNLS